MKQKIIRNAIMFVCLAGLLTTVTACIKNATDECSAKAAITFSFVHNPEFTDRFPESVNTLTLFLFDESGNFLYSMHRSTASLENGNTLTVELPAVENYTVVAWGNPDEACYRVTGSGHIDNMKMELITDANGASGHDIADLFYGSTTIHVTQANQRITAQVPMIRDTNDVKVIITGLNYDPSEYDLNFFTHITGTNGAGWFDNSIATAAVTYSPGYTDVTYHGKLCPQATFKVMRLQQGSDVTLTVGKEQAWSRSDNLVDLILANFPDINTDSDLDRYSDYTFVYNVDSGAFALTAIHAEDWTATPGQMGGV